jgi:hypothetical protein
MAHKNITDPNAVKKAIAEFDRLGEDKFFKKYKFGPAKDYIIFYNGRKYPSKAILGVAHGFEFPELGHLTTNDFTGGKARTTPNLERLGFTIIQLSRINRPIVLTENEVTIDNKYDHWQDVTGERYHFPNKYINLITEGRPFVYYRGVWRTGGKRQQAEYFGYGEIGPVTRDPSISLKTPKNKWHWYAEISDYRPFLKPVPAKVQGDYFEHVKSDNYWRDAVRGLSVKAFERILEYAGVVKTEIPAFDASLPAVADVEPKISAADTSLLVLHKPADATNQHSGASGGRWSPYSKKIGDRAEEIVYRHLLRTLPDNESDTVRWVARDGETPGWDIEYTNSDHRLIAVEVKGTSGAAFPSIEITARELMAAEKKGDRYWLYLVSNCLQQKPTIEPIRNPYALMKRGILSAVPTNYRITKVDES